MLSTTANALVMDEMSASEMQPEQWARLLQRGDTQTVFQTQGWQEAWWKAFGRGRRLFIAAQRAGETVALAPLFADGGLVFFSGSGGADYLDFIGDVSDVEVLEAVLEAAREQTLDFVGFRFYHVPDDSRTGRLLSAAGQRLGLVVFDEGSLAAPALDLLSDPARAQAAAARKSLVRHERYFQRAGQLAVQHFREAAAILPELPRFMDQHQDRWAQTASPSLFLEPQQRRFYEHLTRAGALEGWLRFTRIDFDGRPMAFHFGFAYQGSFLWYKPSFEIELSRHSPGEVLLRHLLLESVRQGDHTFDFGLGDEPFKRRFASHVRQVRTWGLYPPEQVRPDPQGTGGLV